MMFFLHLLPENNCRKMPGFWILLIAVHTIYSCAALMTSRTYHEVLKYGQHFSIKLPVEVDWLEYISVNETQREVLWSRLSTTKRGKITGTGSDRKFVISSVTYEDQGSYTLFNFWNKKTDVYLLKVVVNTGIQYCVAGESLNIYLDGLPKNDVTLHFSSKDFNLTLVERGSPVGNLHPDYMGRIQVTGSSIEVQNVNVSDVGNYTLSDRLNRKVKIISMNLIDHRTSLMSLLVLLGIPPCIFCCCKKRICRKNSQPTTTINTTTTVKYDDQILPPGPPPAYNSFPVPAPAGPIQGYTPGYPPVGECTVHPPPNPIIPPQQPYSGYPATSADMPPNPPYYPGYPAAFGFPPAQPPYCSGAPSNQPAPVAFAPVMYNSPAGSEPIKGDIPPTTPLLTQPEGYTPGYPAVGESICPPPSGPTLPPHQPYTPAAVSPNPVPPAVYTGNNILNSSDSAVQFSVGKDLNVNFL